MAHEVIGGGARVGHCRFRVGGSSRCSGQVADALLGGLGPGERPGRTGQGLHQGDGHPDEVRVRPLDELRRPLHQRAQLAQQALRPHHRRQPVDRRIGGERPLHQAERLLRQGAYLHERLHGGDGGRLFRVAQEHAELLGAAGDGRRRRLDLSQGLVRQAGAARRVQAEVQSRARAAEDLGRVARGRPNSSPARRSTARRCTAATFTRSADPKASPWA